MIEGLTAGQWFMISGALIFLFGLGLILVVLRPAPRPVRHVPVNTITRAVRTSPYPPPPYTRVPPRTRVMPRVHDRGPMG
jgi:hypothetical protein